MTYHIAILLYLILLMWTHFGCEVVNPYWGAPNFLLSHSYAFQEQGNDAISRSSSTIGGDDLEL